MPTTSPTVRISLRWVLIIIALIFGIGMVGGIAGQQLAPPPLVLRPIDNNQVVSSVQEVTISPNTATSDLVDQAERSVMSLVPSDNPNATPVASGFVVTNDGLLVTTATVPNIPLAALDTAGNQLTLQRVGTDELFGLTFFRLTDNIVIPLDMRRGDPHVGETLVAVMPATEVPGSRIESYTVRTYALPAAAAPVGQQRLLVGSTLPTISVGSPLLDEGGKVSGIIITPELGEALPISHVQESFARVTTNKREDNPFITFGFTPAYSFSRPTVGDTLTFTVTATNVTVGGVAARSGLKRGDIITAINETSVSWNQSVASMLVSGKPPILTVQREDTTLRLPLTGATPTPTPSPTPQ